MAIDVDGGMVIVLPADEVAATKLIGSVCVSLNTFDVEGGSDVGAIVGFSQGHVECQATACSCDN
jgi:hypothetical protein